MATDMYGLQLRGMVKVGVRVRRDRVYGKEWKGQREAVEDERPEQ
jgi:hypothetical protein